MRDTVHGQNRNTLTSLVEESRVNRSGEVGQVPFLMSCFIAASTGIKFVVITDPRQMAVDGLLKKLYEVYADFALKNPFYSLDMPIR